MFSKDKVKQIIRIDGMTCNHCKNNIIKELIKIDGIIKVKVDLKEKTATITSKNKIDNEIIVKSIESNDYKVLSII